MRYITDEYGKKIKLEQCSVCKRSVTDVPKRHLTNIKCPDGIKWICDDCESYKGIEELF